MNSFIKLSIDNYSGIFVSDKYEWYMYGKRHREYDMPAVIWDNHCKEWYQHGKLHRDNDKPAVVKVWGDHYFHRVYDQPVINYSCGMQCWYKHGKRYRENGPAIIWGDGDNEEKWKTS
jgi:hypothetical protein